MLRRALFLLLCTLGLTGCDKSEPKSPTSTTAPAAAAPSADLEQAKQLIAAGALVVDVREQGEWDEGHLAQAKLFPVGTVGEQLAAIEQAAGGKDKPVVVYCKSGGRAGRAKQTLEAAGFTNVVNAGGYRALAAATAPTP
jgi:phage shock protein E